jgi:hypothetical protein
MLSLVSGERPVLFFSNISQLFRAKLRGSNRKISQANFGYRMGTGMVNTEDIWYLFKNIQSLHSGD